MLNKKSVKISILLVSLVLILTIVKINISETNKYYLDYNILEFMKDGFDDPVISNFYQKDIEDVQNLTNRPIRIRYFDVDLNDDGLQDKIIIIRSSLHSGSGGDKFTILINNGTSYIESCYLQLKQPQFERSELPSQSQGPSVRILNDKKKGFRSLEVFFDDSMYSLQKDKDGKNEYIKVSDKKVIFRLEYINGRYTYVANKPSLQL